MDGNGRDKRLALLAGRQAGVFALEQAVALGFPKATVGRRVRDGAWERRHSGVYVVAGSDTTRLQDLWAASLAVGNGAVLSHETAALIHGAERLSSQPIVLTNPHRWHHRIDGAFVHQIDDLASTDIRLWGGLRVSSPARCVVELGATQPETVVGRVADDLVRMGKTSHRAIETVFRRVVRHGKPGMLTIARVLDERADGNPPPDSELERLLFAVLAAGGLPTPRRQVPLPGRGGVRGLVDGAYLDARLILEADGRRWHRRLEAARRDRVRDAQAARAGWQTLRFGYEELVGDPDEVCAVVRETRAVRLSGSAAA
jgi:very-short-patch-repair endonuclease